MTGTAENDLSRTAGESLPPGYDPGDAAQRQVRVWRRHFANVLYTATQRRIRWPLRHPHPPRHRAVSSPAQREKLLLLPILALLLAAFATPAAPADRVVSLNLCTDQLLVLLAPEKVAALSPLARDPALSFVATRAASLPIVRSSAEAVLRLHPDLVLAGPYGAQTTLALLQAEGVPIHRIDLPQDFAAIRKQTRQMATLLGVPERGEALLAAMDATLAAVRRPTHSVMALAWEPRGYTAGPGTLMDAVLRAAGLTNVSDGRQIGLEALLRHEPDLLVVPRAPDYPSLATDLLRNPAVAGIPPRRNAAGPDDLCRPLHRRGRRHAGAMIRCLALLAGVLFMLSLLVGDGTLALPDRLILLQIRLPRTLLAALVGGGLGLSGAVLQGALRNPLADPGLLGITGTAGLGAVVAFYWGLAQSFAPALPLGGLVGAAIGAGCLLGFAGRAPSGPSLILAGVAVSALAAALLALALTLAPNPFALAEITFWLLGGLADRSLLHVALAAPPILLGGAILLRLGPGLDALSLGEETAASLGVPVGHTLRLAALGTALAVGTGAAVAGGIGFVGLVVPHLLRPALGERPGALLPASLLAGAALLLAADLLVRLAPLLLPLTQSPPLGVLTALLGAPFLVAIARRAAP